MERSLKSMMLTCVCSASQKDVLAGQVAVDESGRMGGCQLGPFG